MLLTSYLPRSSRPFFDQLWPLFSGQLRTHRSLSTSGSSNGGSMSSSASTSALNEAGGQGVGSRRPPTSLSVLSATSLAEVTKTIRDRHASVDGGLSPPPRVVSLEDSRGFKVMTELVDHPEAGNDPQGGSVNQEQENTKPKTLSSKYKPLKPISSKRKWQNKINDQPYFWRAEMNLLQNFEMHNLSKILKMWKFRGKTKNLVCFKRLFWPFSATFVISNINFLTATQQQYPHIFLSAKMHQKQSGIRVMAVEKKLFS